jgi:hypothetical protein
MLSLFSRLPIVARLSLIQFIVNGTRRVLAEISIRNVEKLLRQSFSQVLLAFISLE